MCNAIFIYTYINIYIYIYILHIIYHIKEDWLYESNQTSKQSLT